MASSPIFVDHRSTSSYGSPGPSSQQTQHRLLDRVSTLFGGGKKKPGNNFENNTQLSQTDSILNEDRNASCVDSMYSSLQSRRSVYHSNTNVPAPLKTVQLDNPIVHLPTPTPPTPPHHPSLNSTMPSPPIPQRKLTPPALSPQKIEDVEAQFKLLLREYAPSADHINNVNNLTVEQKEMLLRSSRSPALLKKNSTFSHIGPSFSLRATFGLKTKTKRSDHPFLNSSFDYNDTLNSEYSGNLKKAYTAPGRYRRSGLPDSYTHTSRSKLKSTPEYFVNLLRETHVRDLEDSEVLDLRVFLRSVVVSWTSEFLSLGGYEAIANLFKQMKEAPKRMPNDNRIIQHLGKCLKTIMTHESMGTQIVLRNPIALYHVRDILFGPANKKLKQVYGLEISTRSLLLNLMCTLATIQTSSTTEYVHGYDVLRRLLLDRPSDKLVVDDTDKKSHSKHTSPFPITLKTDPKEILQMIMENDPNGQVIGKEYEWDQNELRPRYTAWMRELHYTVEKHIETITFLAQVLNYDFKSAYRQIKARQNLTEQEAAASNNDPEEAGAVMTEEGVVDYIVTHLRLIRTVVTTQPTSYMGYYDEYEQEKMRVELMLSGFDKISKILIQCPHPTVRASYINYLKPLMMSCAELTIPNRRAATTTTTTTTTTTQQPPPLPSRRPGSSYIGPDLRESLNDTLSSDEEDNYEISVYAEDNTEEIVHHSVHNTVTERQWQYENEPYFDDIFQDEEYIEDHFNSTDEESDKDVQSDLHSFVSAR